MVVWRCLHVHMMGLVRTYCWCPYLQVTTPLGRLRTICGITWGSTHARTHTHTHTHTHTAWIRYNNNFVLTFITKVTTYLCYHSLLCFQGAGPDDGGVWCDLGPRELHLHLQDERRDIRTLWWATDIVSFCIVIVTLVTLLMLTDTSDTGSHKNNIWHWWLTAHILLIINVAYMC